MKKSIFITMIFSLIFMVSLSATEITFNYHSENIRIKKVNNYDFIKYKDFETTLIPGAPSLPIDKSQLSIPAQTEIAAIKVIKTESEFLDEKFKLYPAQPPVPLSKSEDEIDFVPSADEYYKTKSLFPLKVVEKGKRGYLSGYNIASLIIHPFQYDPSSNRVKFYSHIEVKITLRQVKEQPAVFSKRSKIADDHLKSELVKLIDNPQELKTAYQGNPVKSTKLPDEEHLYVIITSDNLSSEFEELANWKTQKGYSAEIVTLDWIFSEYTGADDAAKIRNFIKDAYQNWGTLWVLLGGDTQIVPVRKAFAFDCEYGDYYDNYIPCDLYYSDLDGSWNENGNDVYGEVSDDIDMYPDVFVGRAGVEDIEETIAFVDKIQTYEKNPPADFALEMLYLAMVLWWDPYTDSGIGKNLIDELYVPPRFDPIEKLYQSQGNEDYDSVMDALNEGKNFVNHDGHAWWNVMGIGTSHLYNSDMDILTNGPAYSVLYSIGCWPAAIDYNCIAEHFLTNPDGGGVAFVGNSRYGWGSPGNPEYGYSDRFDQEFYHQIFDNGINTIGNSVGAIKSTYVPFSAQENVYRWCEYEINLLGDPLMPMWTDEPQQLSVSFPDTIPLGTNQCNITVTYEGEPVEGALVCLMDGQDIYLTVNTDLDGQTSIPLEATDPSREISITVTAKNFVPFEDTIQIDSDLPFVNIADFTLNNLETDYIEPNDTISMGITLKNYGSETVNNIELLISNTNSAITLVDSVESYNSLGANDSVNIAAAFEFTTSEMINDGEVSYLNYQISDEDNNLWQNVIGLVGVEPLPSYYIYELLDTLGNDNGIAEPGEIVNPHLILKNNGLLSADDVAVTLSTNSTYLSIPYCVWNYGDIAASDYAAQYLEVGIEEDCPTPLFPKLYLNMDHNGITTVDSFQLAIGEQGFKDDMESGAADWTHSGSNDLWHQTNFKSVSGDYSWYCGDSLTHRYVNDMDASLTSEEIVLDENSELSFWCWYDFPNYGTDGFYVQIQHNSDWETLDFIGSGGALETLTTGNDWLPYKYDLSQYPAGTVVKLRFKMFSNSEEIGKGSYIDDVIITKDNIVISPQFHADVVFGDKPLEVHFTDETTTLTDSVSTWLWEFGDGETSTQESPVHLYTAIGKKTVKLTVTDEFGFTATQTRHNYIDVASGGGNVIYVAQDGSGDFPNLYQGLSNVYDGDTLLVGDGIYTGSMNKNIDLEGKDVVIISENGNDNCFLDGEGNGFSFKLESCEQTLIKGITFKNFNNLSEGGALFSNNSSFTIENCLFDSCSSSEDGGAIYIFNGDEIHIQNSDVENSAADYGGAIAAFDVDSLEIHNSSFMNNTAGKGAGVYLENNKFAIVDSSSFFANESSSMGGGLFDKNSKDLFISKCEFVQNTAEYGGGSYFTSDSSSFIVNVEESDFNDNSVSQYGGGIYSLAQSGTLKYVVLEGNSAIRGGGVALEGDSDFTIENCLLYDNTVSGNSGFGGGVYMYNSTCLINNCTLTRNFAQNYGSAAMAYSSTLDVENSILWADSTAEELTHLNSAITVTYSDVQGSYQGTGNIELDPEFNDPTFDNYEITATSPCIDVGWNDYVNSDADLAGNQRVWDGNDDGDAVVDMGCYEFGAPPISVDAPHEIVPTLSAINNYPNPFSIKGNINIEFTLSKPQKITISVYNILGQKVKTLTEDFFVTGNHTVEWNGQNKNRQTVSSGIYLYRIKTEERNFVKKIVLIK